MRLNQHFSENVKYISSIHTFKCIFYLEVYLYTLSILHKRTVLQKNASSIANSLHLSKWLNANKISLNVSKTEMVLFRPKRKSMDFNLKIKLNGKRLYETNSVKYLGIRIDYKLNWKAHINDIALKLITANAMLYKVRDFVGAGILKSICHTIFESHIHYACIIWGQNVCTIN